MDKVDRFVNKVYPAIKNEVARRGYSPQIADYILTQFALESDYGEKVTGKNNFSGTKWFKTMGNRSFTEQPDHKYANFKNVEDQVSFHISNIVNNWGEDTMRSNSIDEWAERIHDPKGKQYSAKKGEDYAKSMKGYTSLNKAIDKWNSNNIGVQSNKEGMRTQDKWGNKKFQMNTNKGRQWNPEPTDDDYDAEEEERLFDKYLLADMEVQEDEEFSEEELDDPEGMLVTESDFKEDSHEEEYINTERLLADIYGGIQQERETRNKTIMGMFSDYEEEDLDRDDIAYYFKRGGQVESDMVQTLRDKELHEKAFIEGLSEEELFNYLDKSYEITSLRNRINRGIKGER